MGGHKTGKVGSFPRTKREMFGGAKIHLFKFGVKYLNFGATYLSLGAIYLKIGAIYLNFGDKIENRLFSKGVRGREGGPPGPPGGLVIGVWKKYSAHLLKYAPQSIPPKDGEIAL